MQNTTIDWPTLATNHPALSIIPPRLRDVARPKSFRKGQLLYRQGQRPAAMMFVLEGEIRLVRHATDGAEIVLQRTRGGFIAEASLDAQAYHCDVVCAANGSILLFPRAAFQTALDNDPAFDRAWRELLGREIRRLRAQTERLTLNNAADRILHYIETEGRDGTVTLNQTVKSWALELGITHEALYRALRRLANAGILEHEANRFWLRR